MRLFSKFSRIALICGLAFATGGVPSAFSTATCAPLDKSAKAYRVNYFTNYAPIVGGINGSCGKSASGKDACQYFLEDYLHGQTNSVMIAIPQYDCPPEGWKWVRPRNRPKYKVNCQSRCPGFYNPDMFGGVYRSEEFELSLRRHGIQAACVPLDAADRYAKSESCKSKIDMVTRAPKSRLSGIINSIRNSQLVLIDRSGNIPPPRRKIERNPYAAAEIDAYYNTPLPIPRPPQDPEPVMPSREEDEQTEAAAAAAAASYNLYESNRNKAMQERARRDAANKEILKQYQMNQKLTQPHPEEEGKTQ